jgi:hypothetical protein
MNLYSLSTYKVNILIKHRLISEISSKSPKLLSLRYSTAKFKHPIAFLIISIIINLVSTSPYPNTTILKPYHTFSNVTCLSQVPSFFCKVIRF